MSGKRIPVPETMFIGQIDPGKMKLISFDNEVDVTLSADGKNFIIPDITRPGMTVEVPYNTSGYLMYFNNGHKLTADIKLFVKAKLHYGFGYFLTEWITVPVKKTIGNNDSTAAGQGGEGEGGEGGDTPGEGGEGGETPGGETGGTTGGTE